MAADGVVVKVEGIPDLRRELDKLPPKLRQRALLNALRAGGRVVRDAARRLVPVLRMPIKRRGRIIRQPGTVKRAISVRTSKEARRRGDVGVYINVRPARKGLIRGGKVIRESQRGAESPKDPYYWRWLEFGRQGRPGEAARKRVKRLKVGGEVVVKGIRFRRARRAVAPMRAYRFLRGAAQQLPQALSTIIARLGPAVQRILDKQASQ